MKEARSKKSLYLIGPLIAGSFFALGYGITHRTWILLSDWKEIASQEFVLSKKMPGRSLESVQSEFGKPSANSRQNRIPKNAVTNEIPNNIKTDPIKINNESLLVPENQKTNEPMFSQENFNKVFKTLTEY